jgi:hypothetical protein
MTPDRTVAFLGLPRTGKSTYLGALWLLVQDPAVPDIWEEDVTGDRSYIDSLAQQVANGDEIQRTNVETDQGMALSIGFGNLGVARLTIPDLSGEAVRELVEDRLCRKALAATLWQSEAVVLFVNPDHIDFPTPTNMAFPVPGQNASDSPLPEFAPENACTAAKLVELLENVVELRWKAWPIPIVVVVSAWDRVDQGLTPDIWLQMRLPGVSGFLETNPDLTTHQVFGVSAQGGRIPEEREHLLAKGDVSQRVFAFAGDGAQAQLFDPLRWALWQA